MEIFSQEKSQLVILFSKASENFYLEMCVIPGNSYLNLRNNYSRAKKNTVNFFDGLIDKEINSVEVADNDRVIKFSCSESSLFFTIRGKFTNIIYSDKDETPSCFKSLSEQELLKIMQELKELNFISGWNPFNIQPDDEISIDDIRKKYPFLGSEIVKEVKARNVSHGSNSTIDKLNEVLKEIRESKPCVFINEPEQEVHIGFDKFRSFPFTEKKVFESTPEAVNFLLSKKHYLTRKHSKIKLIKNHLEKEMKKIASKINNLQAVIDRGSREKEYSKYGNLLLANLGLIKSRMTSIVLEDILENGDKIKIDLNPKLSPQKNVEYYFDKSRSEKTSFVKNIQLLEKAKKDFDNIHQIQNSLNDIESLKDLDTFMKKLKIKSTEVSTIKEDLSSKFKQYIIDDKYKVYVGKDSKNNDLLTTRFAKQNDYWFHARSVSGSHVVLRVENTKESIPKPILKKAASLAAFHSKAKTAGVVPVAYTFKKYVVKKKGFPIGTVHLLREDVLLVKPEIPDGCEYIT
jgi:predicted ribosome quality control (RQC) complex YloA/Tae2 family protein